MTTSPSDTPAAPPLSALDMARNLTGNIEQIARASETDPVQAHVLHLGQQGFQNAQMAGNLALVSIAEDIHRIARDVHMLLLERPRGDLP